MKASTTILCAVFLGLGVGAVLSACGGSVQAANRTPAILAGYCQWSSAITGPYFMTGLGGDSDCAPTQSSASDSGLPMTSEGTLKNLQALGWKEGDVITVLVNGVSTGITCTLPSGGGFGGTCSDMTHTASVKAGDLVAVEAATSASGKLQVALEKQ